jgi:hypothetical protein
MSRYRADEATVWVWDEYERTYIKWRSQADVPTATAAMASTAGHRRAQGRLRHRLRRCTSCRPRRRGQLRPSTKPPSRYTTLTRLLDDYACMTRN